MNLLEETTRVIKENGKRVSGVLWVGNSKARTTWNKFAPIANIDYDSGFGGTEVSEDLLVVGKDWWLERHEYDGSEWWEFKTLPVKPKKLIKLKALTMGQARAAGHGYFYGGDGLEHINGNENVSL